MNLEGKKLLVLTGCNGADHIIQYAKKSGVYTIATDYYQISPIKDMADCRYNVSTTDIDAICDIAKKHNIDGITTGTSEASIYSILELSKRLNIPFYANAEQLNTINNKKRLKDLLASFNIPVTKEFKQESDIEYPVVVKPADSSGSKGISVCQNGKELAKAYDLAKYYSRTKQVLVEKCLNGLPEVFFNYTIVDGKFSLSCAFDNHKMRDTCGFAGDAVINIYPSERLQKFINTTHLKLVAALKSIGINNGVISIQSFFDGENFFIYEAGYRLGGTQSYIFTKKLNGISHMEMMVNFALTGNMLEGHDVLENDNPFFNRPCCQRNIIVKPGVIKTIEGLIEVKKLKEVLNVTEVHREGDLIKADKFKGKTCLRIHIIGDSMGHLSETVEKINSTIVIKDEKGRDMVLERTSLEELM